MKKQAYYNITFGGIGGQGIIKASELLGWAAMYDGYHVKKSEVHGMSQRGGSVESHVRFGKKIYSPLIGPGQADFLLCFHADEHPRLVMFLKSGGTDLVEYLKRAEAMVENPKHVNTALMGVLSVFLPISGPSWQKAMETVFSPKILDENKQVFQRAQGLVIK
ncbi:MAG: 2-oxoacid:acceptor oxidoreductase family protein [Planctomycetales bacterium]|nr:2-oxoacid:acceptor oxidoreductase family protein [Planctomycetales bacterium]